MLNEIVYDGPPPRNLEELERRVDEAILAENLRKQQLLMTLYDSAPKLLRSLEKTEVKFVISLFFSQSSSGSRKCGAI